ncbi:MAG: prepilin-type N-terminal cleavage/methylation domain-containing protein, partial [Candidatus Omnitrophica bacterium]|nr:prepilin-type N-terminal cleavage/methylation domain-containing protein [Candidatus Omnitrophota bacterium]
MVMVLAGNEMIKAIAAFWGGNPNKRRPLFFAPRAFTLVEIMVVVMIIGLIAAFGIPNFKKALLKSRERSAMLHLSAINGANEIYKARN